MLANFFTFKKGFYYSALVLAVPGLLQRLVSVIVPLVDNMMVGGINANAVAGVTVVNQIMFIFMVIVFGIGGAAGIFIAQYNGAGNATKVTHYFLIQIFVSCAIGLLFFVLLSFFPNSLLRIFVDDEAVFYYAHIYLAYTKYVTLLFPISGSVALSFRKLGYMKFPLYIAIIASFFSIFLNAGLIHGNFGMPAMGVAGAGLGTLVARFIELIVSIGSTIVLATPIKLKLLDLFKVEKSTVANFIQKGKGLVFNELLWAIGFQSLIIAYTQRIGENVAIFSMASVFIAVMASGMGGTGSAISYIIGNQLGKGDFAGAKRDSQRLIKMSACIGICLGIITTIVSYFVLRTYNVDPSAIQMAQYIIIVAAIFNSLHYLTGSFYFILSAGGDMRSVLIIDAGWIWVTVFVAFMVGFLNIPILWHFTAVQFLVLLNICISFHFYKKENWVINLTV